MIELPKLYPITDARVSNLSHAEQVARLSDGGASFIQLREKHQSPREFYLQAAAALHRARERGVRLIINDRVDIALALQADGVHLGQDDMPPHAARELLGKDAIIGYSTHNPEQVREALRLPIDYVAFGPIFSTSSKENPDAVVGLEGLHQVRHLVGRMPLVAIGGISLENARAVVAAGADAVACISLLLSNPAEIGRQTAEILAILRD